MASGPEPYSCSRPTEDTTGGTANGRRISRFISPSSLGEEEWVTNSGGRISTTASTRAPQHTSSERPKAARKRSSLHSARYHLKVSPSGRMVADQLVDSE